MRGKTASVIHSAVVVQDAADVLDHAYLTKVFLAPCDDECLNAVDGFSWVFAHFILCAAE